MNTNAPERSGEPPLLERFVLRYYIFGTRAAPHALVLGAPPPAPEVKKGIRREFLLNRILGLVLSKLQIDGVVSFPCKLVFKSYYERFLAELRKNPWIDCDPPTSGDRRSSIIENMYGFLVNRMAIHRLFVEQGAPYAGADFRVEQLLDAEREMATGDMQTAILAIGAYSHSFRSPTEYRVAELLSSLAMTRLVREYKKKASEEGLSLVHKAFYEAGPCGVMAWSPAQEAALEPFLGNKEMDEEDRYLGAKYKTLPAAPRALLGARYIPVTVLPWGSHAPTKFEACDMLAHVLLEGQVRGLAPPWTPAVTDSHCRRATATRSWWTTHRSACICWPPSARGAETTRGTRPWCSTTTRPTARRTCACWRRGWRRPPRPLSTRCTRCSSAPPWRARTRRRGPI